MARPPIRKLAAISIDCEIPVPWGPPGEVDALLGVAEEQAAPLTWLIYSGATRPTQVADYYQAHVLSRLPDSHEVGLHVHFDDHELQNYVSDAVSRTRLIERGLEVLQARGLRPTSFRAGCLCLQPGDIEALERGGILVDSSPCPGGTTNHPEHVDWKDLALREPYHPSYSSLLEKGHATLIVLPVCSSQERDATGHCAWGYAEYQGWPNLRHQLEWYVDNAQFVVIGTHDGRASPGSHAPSEVLGAAIRYLRSNGFEFVTLSQMGLAWATVKGEHP